MTITIFDDALAADWQNYSWDTYVDFNHDVTVRDGERSLHVDFNAGWAGFYLALPDGQQLDVEPSDTLTFAINGGQFPKEISVFVVNENNDWVNATVLSPAVNSWSEVSIPMSSVGSPEGITGLVFQEFEGTDQGPFQIDNLVLRSQDSEPTQPPSQPTEPPGPTEVAQLVYGDSLESSWQNWSWESSINTDNRSQANSGSSSISAKHNQPWAGFYLAAPESISTEGLGELHFSINGGAGGQVIEFAVLDEFGASLRGPRFTPEANSWTDYRVDLDALGGPSAVTGLIWQEYSGNGNQNTFYVDDVFFTADGTSSNPVEPNEPGAGPTIAIDPTNIVREIDDNIYGLNFADASLAADLDLSVDRWGGNSTTRYNYQIDASNRGSDWFFENHPEERVDPNVPLPGSSSLNDFIRKDQNVGADSIITANLVGWVTNSRDIIGGFEIDKYGPQQEENPWRENGNGIRPDGTPITGNDPTDTSFAVDQQWTAGMVEYLVSEYGTAAEGGVQFYALDNEPMLWSFTHRDVHPEPASYDEVLEKGIATAGAIKSVDPTAEVLGPTVFGWTAYFYSQLDIAGGGAFWLDPQDQNAHGGLPFLQWYLQEMAETEAETGTRLLDYLDIHYYPQQDGVTLTRGGGTPAVQASRLESTRSLWDPTYKDPTWIDTEVQLIPRMRDWIDEFYPGTKLAITEYNFGATAHINGAVTQADVLGVFGREGVDLATMWAPPNPDDPTAYSFRMYRNYDGEGDDGSRFGNLSVAASSSDQSDVSVYAAQRESDDALTVMLINKSADDLTTPIQLPDEYDGLSAEVYTYDASNLGAIVRGDQAIDLNTSGQFRATLPGSSITLLEIPTPFFSGSEVADPSVPVSAVMGERMGAPDQLLGFNILFDGDASDSLDLKLTRNGEAVDLDGLIPTWNATALEAFWDLSPLNLQPGRYLASIETSGGAFQQDLLLTYRGDANQNGHVGFDDFLSFANGLGKATPTWSDGDFDGDGELTFDDFLDLAQNFGKNVDEVFANA